MSAAYPDGSFVSIRRQAGIVVVVAALTIGAGGPWALAAALSIGASVFALMVQTMLLSEHLVETGRIQESKFVRGTFWLMSLDQFPEARLARRLIVAHFLLFLPVSFLVGLLQILLMRH